MKNLIIALFTIGCFSIAWSQEKYSLSSESSLTVDGSSTLHDWTVTANTIDGALINEGNVLKEVSFSVEVASIISERGKTMDKKTHNALKKEEHPQVLFSAANVAFSGGDNQSISGKLNIAGVEKDVVFSTTIKNTGDLQITGNYKITLQDYNMEPPTAMFGSIVVGDDVTVNFDLIFVKN
ncbi:YceI family protein [Maribacter sp. HTCC2170]|uniref:YceI family protein n=1 Tax=Maribacter sp. (strain HTCC2170 / KCCM 42371) TaxID=313603 RepID=UPI00006AE5C8|nr:YceI family protein [Maribacter sp. HTCC2170]EAR00583.1 hypothetical protein FB2170_08759 [Maribacter sp. HTCC2170]